MLSTPAGQRGQQSGAGGPAARGHHPGDQRAEHGGHAERGGPEQDQELQDPAAAGGGEVCGAGGCVGVGVCVSRMWKCMQTLTKDGRSLFVLTLMH